MFRRSLSLTIAAYVAVPLAACSTVENGQAVASTPAPAPAAEAQGQDAPRAKNVIVFIGDGMGVSTVTAMRIYAGQKRGQSGEDYVLPFETFDNVALVKTYNTNAQVPDSAGTATAIHSGEKTKIGMLGVGPEATYADCASGLAHPLPLLGEEVKERGLALGIVSTARITHATPASVYARSPDREWEAYIGAEGQADVGCKDIATQLVESDFDVALGGGKLTFFSSSAGGIRRDEVADLPADWAAKTGGTFVADKGALARAPMDRPVFGLFSDSHMAYMADPARNTNEPTLTEMTAEAIKRLAQDEDGYYLMVESGRIDHAHHMGQAGVALEEGDEFANAIQHAIDNTDPADTLILVTADHSHVFTIAGYPRRGNDILGLVVPPEGGSDVLAEVTTAADGKPYTTLGYLNGPGAIAGMAERPVPETGIGALQQAAIPTRSETHAGEDVALYGQGPGADNIRGVIEQDVIYDIIRKAYGWEE